MTPAQALLAAWYARCGTSSGGDNLIAVNGSTYVISHPEKLGNGAIKGRIYRFAGRNGLADLGGYHIGADGSVIRLPDELRDTLPCVTPEQPEQRPWPSFDDQEAA